MKGTIRPISRQRKCPKCGRPFQHVPKLGYICADCKTVPNRFYIDLHWKGKRPRICSDMQGQPLDTYDRALNLPARIQHEIDNHSFDPSRYVVSDQKKFWASTLLDEFLAYKADSLAPSYVKDFKRYVRAAKEFFKTSDVRDIRKYDIIAYKKFLEHDFVSGGKTSKKNKKGKTVKNYLDVFKTFMMYLKNDLEILQAVPSFPDVEVEEYEWKWLDVESQVLLLSHIPEKDRPIIIFLMLHGCRPGEARALKVKDVNLKERYIRISSTFSGSVIRSRRKGRRARAVTIPIHPEMYEYLADRVSNNLPEAFVFTNPRTGGPYSMASLDRVWDKARTAAGITKDLRLYDASRHSFASQLVNNDVSIYSVSKLLGHSSIKMTEKYAHSNIEKLRADIVKLSLNGKVREMKTVNRPSFLDKSLSHSLPVRTAGTPLHRHAPCPSKYAPSLSSEESQSDRDLFQLWLFFR